MSIRPKDVFIENGSNVEVSGSSIIEDAHNALHIEDGPAYTIDGVIFNRNYWHVQFSEPNASLVYAVGMITDSLFLCQTMASIGGSHVHELLLSPRENNTTNLHVWAWVTRGLKVSDNNA